MLDLRLEKLPRRLDSVPSASEFNGNPWLFDTGPAITCRVQLPLAPNLNRKVTSSYTLQTTLLSLSLAPGNRSSSTSPPPAKTRDISTKRRGREEG